MSIHNLSTSGAITNNKSLAIRLLKNFMVSDYSQSNLYMGNVSSLRYLISQFDTVSELELRDSITSQLTSMYGRYFDDVDVEVFTEESIKDKSLVNIKIDIRVIQDGKTIYVNEIINKEELEQLYSSKT